jgi:hypothetical protein
LAADRDGAAMLGEDVETSQLKIPEWLEKGTIRCDSDLWSDASSDAEDIGNLEELENFAHPEINVQEEPTPSDKYDQKKEDLAQDAIDSLQETITTSSRENLKGVKYKWHKHGVLNAIAESGKNMESGVFKYEGDPSFITRESLSGSLGGRGISHIMVDAGAEQFYVGGCVDNIIASTNITTDHHIVAADFALQIEDIEFNQAETSTIKHQWGKISNILMDQSEDASVANGFRIWPKMDTPRTEQWHKN